MLLIAASLLIAATSASLDDRLKREVDRLDALLKTKQASLPKQYAELPYPYRPGLDRVRQAKTPETRLYRMRGIYSGIEGIAYIADHQNAAKDLASLQALWNQTRTDFQKAPAVRGTFLERALQDISTNRAEKLFAASIAYAKVDTPSSGLYYIAEAEGNRKYRQFVRSVASDINDTTTVPSAGRLWNAFDEVQEEAISFFTKDAVAKTMIPVNAKLKETRELLDAK